MSTKNPGLVPFVFKDSGRQVLIKKVSPYLVFELQKVFPAPRPPVQSVDYGDGHEHQEENKGHPEYLAAMEKYNLAFQEKLTRLMIKRGVLVEITPEIKAEIDELRDFWRTEFSAELDADDRMVYVLNLCVGSDKDLEDLINLITRRSQPTEEAIQEAVSGFRN